jgi:hypothetical protein
MIKPTGAVAQLGERRVRNAEVEGSIPFRSIGLLNLGRCVSFSRPVAVHTVVSPVTFLRYGKARASRNSLTGRGAIGGTTAFVEIGSRLSRSSGHTALPLGIPIARTTNPGSLPRRDHSTSTTDSSYLPFLAALGRKPLSEHRSSSYPALVRSGLGIE